ncbi:FmdB family zinc ribbon protein [Desulforamulus ruminis]|uniref:Regulatory protein, FmdB family n=1 Tax=Desulforamulus ruminis (strain ATCC 23193 / DSM 2154 / NCIMB 8452 / DL) TaxID=696281 RepID=F6DKA4_DESRL|nr:zinc ribbon domain-containing protein [Desulforamulus ruminis]AEG61521.1 regulatory protein, FmdB family [Desulforamulus ruminis DSM 2154]
MPIYEFRCQSCNHRFQKLCSLGEKGEKLTCPACQASSPVRVMSGFRVNNPGNLYGSRGDSCKSCTSSNCSACKH